jgi:hypothetical protein
MGRYKCASQLCGAEENAPEVIDLFVLDCRSGLRYISFVTDARGVVTHWAITELRM